MRGLEIAQTERHIMKDAAPTLRHLRFMAEDGNAPATQATAQTGFTASNTRGWLRKGRGMPRPVRAFACEWGCARNVLTSKDRMYKHEARCARNPETKCCPTCDHDELEDIGDGFEYICLEDHKEADVTVVRDCKFWEPKKGASHD